MLRRTGLLVALCAMVVVACGGDSQDEEREVRATARQFVRNLADRDYRRVCRMVTGEVRANWAAFARRNPKHFSTAGCPAFARDFYGRNSIGPGTLRRDMRAIDRASVKVQGIKATITAHPSDRRPGKDDETRLKKVGGQWLLGD